MLVCVGTTRVDVTLSNNHQFGQQKLLLQWTWPPPRERPWLRPPSIWRGHCHCFNDLCRHVWQPDEPSSHYVINAPSTLINRSGETWEDPFNRLSPPGDGTLSSSAVESGVNALISEIEALEPCGFIKQTHKMDATRTYTYTDTVLLSETFFLPSLQVPVPFWMPFHLSRFRMFCWSMTVGVEVS